MNGRFLPEPPLVPIDDGCETAGGCGHEVYPGEILVEWHNGMRYVEICEDCFRDRLHSMTTEKIADAFGCVCRMVEFKTKR